jgi:parallel beta-helix repeat protein
MAGLEEQMTTLGQAMVVSDSPTSLEIMRYLLKKNGISANSIRDSYYGIKITQSEDNTAINNKFARVGKEYFLSDDSALNIRDQDFTEVDLGGGSGGNSYNVTNTGEIESEQ